MDASHVLRELWMRYKQMLDIVNIEDEKIGPHHGARRG
jgi:hypothetical protein